MTELETAQHETAMAVRGLLSSTDELFKLAASKTTAPLLSRERNDLHAAYVRIGRLLSTMNG